MKEYFDAEMIEKLFGSPCLNIKIRDCKDEDDWGDDATIGACVKRRDKSFKDLKQDDFGWYLGGNKIAIKSFTFQVTSICVYEDQEEMKLDWILD